MGPTTGRIYVIGGFGGRDANHPYEWNDPDLRPSGQPAPRAATRLTASASASGVSARLAGQAGTVRHAGVLPATTQ